MSVQPLMYNNDNPGNILCLYIKSAYLSYIGKAQEHQMNVIWLPMTGIRAVAVSVGKQVRDLSEKVRLSSE